MKKILQICAIDVSFESLLIPLIKALMEQGYTVHNTCSDTGRFQELKKIGLDMIEIPIDRKIDIRTNINSIRRLYMLIKKEKYEIVHVHTPVAAVLGRIASKLAGVRHVIYTAHGFYFHEGMSKWEYHFYYHIEKIFSRYATNYLLLQSKEDYEVSLEERFQRKEHIIHLSNGVDITDKFHPDLFGTEARKQLRMEMGIGEEEIVFAFIGRFVREKGIFELVDAFKQLTCVCPNVRLLMIGEVLPSERDHTGHELVTKMMDDPRIIITGYRKDIPELLSISDAFVLPSYREGLPRSIIEAMAMGKPVIATNIRGCREEIIDGWNGYLVKEKDAFSLYEKMRLLAEDREAREILGKNGRSLAEQHYDERKVIQKQLDLYSCLG